MSATVAGTAYGRPVPSGFLGLSLEYWAIESYAGGDPAALDPVFEQLVRNLAPRQSPLLRIGGDSSDWTWWPLPGQRRPPGVTFNLDPRWLQVTGTLARELSARLILGLNLEAGDPKLAATEARELLGGLGPAFVAAFELGNEPGEYPHFAWYRTAAGKSVPGRPRSYDFQAFLDDFTRTAAALPPHALAGPSTGGQGWMAYLGRFLAAEPRVRLVTVHRYPLQLCYTPPRSPRFPTLGHLLSDAASTGFAQSFAAAVAAAHAAGLSVRIDELNTVSCGAAPAVSRTFASALWALDALFALKAAGVDGVQIHTFPGAGYALFALSHAGSRWSAVVGPQYLGLVMFARAAPPGSRLLRVAYRRDGGLALWASAGPDRRVRVVLINKNPGHSRVVSLRLPRASGPGVLVRLRAPSLRAATGVTLGGQGFDARTSTGRLVGRLRAETVARVRGRYVVALPPASAALLTLAAPAS